MKIKVVLLSMAFVCSAVVWAQAPKGEPQKRQYPSEKMIKELNLSSDQVKQLQDAQEKMRTQMMDLRKNNKDSREKQMDEIKKLRASQRETLKKILTKDQYITYLENELDRRDEMNRGLRVDRKDGRIDRRGDVKMKYAPRPDRDSEQ